MNQNFTEELGRWLNTPAEERDYARGAEMLLQLNGNRIMYVNLRNQGFRNREAIEYNLRKYYAVRVNAFTHEEVVAMSEAVDRMPQLRSGAKGSPLQSGKRGDHDSLPDDVQALYVENLSILQRMRDTHAKLRMLSTMEGQCPDNDRYPYLKELISLDKKYRANWHAYDTYDAEAKVSTMALDSRENDKHYMRLINLNKGKYAKNPSEPLGERIKEWYGKIANPPASVTKALEDLGLL